MSVQAMSWVLDFSKSELGARLVLLSIANHADKYGRNSWAAVNTLAGEARLSERQTRYALRQLETSGELAAVGRHGERLDRQTTVYELALMNHEGQILPPALEHEGQSTTSTRGNLRHPRGAKYYRTRGKILPNEGHSIAPNPSLTVIKPSEDARARGGTANAKSFGEEIKTKPPEQVGEILARMARAAASGRSR